MSQGGGLVVALGGGTARAMSHVGVLQAFEAAGVAPSGLAGTSFGALVAAAFALEPDAERTASLLLAPRRRQVWAQALDFGLHRASLVHGVKLERWLDRTVFRGATFGDLSLPLAIATTSLATGETYLPDSGSLAKAVVASCALPLLFAPVRYGEHYVVDGGFLEAVPFRAGLSLEHRLLLGVNTGIDTEQARLVRWLQRARGRRGMRRFAQFVSSRSLDSAIGRQLRGLGIAGRSYSSAQLVPEGAHLLRIDPRIAWWDFHRTHEAVEAGRTAAGRLLDDGFAIEPAAADGVE